jgi:hypothetical protein
MSELQDFRADKDEFFRHDPQSPLTHEQRATLEGLAYYPENGALVVRGTLVTEGVDLQEEIVMQTTTGGTQTYRRAGIVRFDVDGVTAQVTLFTSSDSDELFLPLRDATSGKETYGAGRYLDVEGENWLTVRSARERRPSRVRTRSPSPEPRRRSWPRSLISSAPDPASRPSRRPP